jgi:hypothetical protein
MQRLIKLVTTVIEPPVEFDDGQLGLQIEKITTEGDQSTMRLVAFLTRARQRVLHHRQRILVEAYDVGDASRDRTGAVITANNSAGD